MKELALNKMLEEKNQLHSKSLEETNEHLRELGVEL